MTVLAIDPGSEQSAWVLYDGHRVLAHDKDANDDLLDSLEMGSFDRMMHVVFEQVASYGMPVGAEVFATVHWAGRFFQAAQANRDVIRDFVHQMPRREVKLHLCQSARAKDSNVRQALLDRFGGEKVAKGTKAAPGPCYGLKADEWQALALAVTWYDLHAPKPIEHGEALDIVKKALEA